MQLRVCAELESDGLLDHLPRDVRRLLRSFVRRLQRALGENLVGVYLIGSIAFPDFVPDRVDLDFHVVVRNQPQAKELQALRDMHRLLVGEYRYGAHLDGLYLPLAKVRDPAPPENLIGFGGEGVGTSAADEAWALHREHIHRGAVLVLEGPDPRTLYPPATWAEIEEALDGELRFIRAHLHHYPFYCVLNLCRLIYTWEAKDVAVSKVAAAGWALEALPARWHPLVRSALRAYRVEEEESDLRRIREGVPSFHRYATARIAEAQAAKVNG